MKSDVQFWQSFWARTRLWYRHGLSNNTPPFPKKIRSLLRLTPACAFFRSKLKKLNKEDKGKREGMKGEDGRKYQNNSPAGLRLFIDEERKRRGGKRREERKEGKKKEEGRMKIPETIFVGRGRRKGREEKRKGEEKGAKREKKRGKEGEEG